MEQISEGGRSIHEIEKQRKRLETEKFELETCLGDAESALEQEENKLLRLSLEVNQVRADIEKRIQEKEEEFEGNDLESSVIYQISKSGKQLKLGQMSKLLVLIKFSRRNHSKQLKARLLLGLF